MYKRIEVSGFISSMRNRFSEAENNILIIKHYNTLDITRKQVQPYFTGDKEEPILLYFQYEPSNMQEAYAPFLEWVRMLYVEHFSASLSPENFIEKANVYPLHKDMLIHYIKKGYANRIDEIILSEIEYEKEQLLLSLMNTFSYVSNTVPLFFVLNQVHYACAGTIELLEKWIRGGMPSTMALLATFNEVYQLPAYLSENWNNCLLLLEEKNLLIDWGLLGEQNIVSNKEVFVINKNLMPDYFSKITTMIHLLSLDQAEYYLEYIYFAVEREKFEITKAEKIQLLMLQAESYIYNGKANKALLSCDALYSLIEKEQDKNIYFNYQYLLGLAQISLLQQSLAKKAAEECKKVACELKDDFLLFKSEVLACYAKYLSWKDLFLCDYQESNPEVFVDKLKKYGYFNLLAYVYGFEFENNESEFEAIAIGEKQPEFMLKSKTISRELKNQYCVLAVIIKNIIKYTDAGYHLYVETLYEERFQILHEMTNPIREGYAFIGLGYNSIIREEYEKANQLFNYGLQIMYQAKESERCAEVLYNMAINCIMAENYKLANDYLIAILKIIKLIEITTLHICNQSKLYGLIALCNFYMGIEYNAFLYFTKLEKILGHLLEEDKEIDNYWSEDLLLYYFLMALFHKKQNEVEKAIISLEKAFGYYESTEGVKYFYCVFLTQELSSCYFLLHQNEKAYAVIQEGLQYCRQKDLTHKIYQLESFMNSSDKEVIDAHVEEIAVSIDDILMNAKNDSMQLQLKERQRDIDFIALWQDTIGKFSYSGEMLIHNSMPALQNMYQLDGLIFVSDNNGEMDIRYSDSSQEITEKMCKKIFSYFKRMPFAFVSNRDDKDFLEYREIIGLFNQTKVVAILGIPIIRNRYVHSFLIGYTKLQQRARANRTNLTSADLIATKFAFSQLMDKLEQLESQHEIQAMNEKLRYSAIFDQLTNLYNRKGFHEKMGYYQKRYEVRNSTQVLLYLDLDNFKFYNDNFGHEIGDMVLVAFSKLLIDCKKEEGCVVRYGGDEFLIVFPNKDAKYAVGIANDIYRKMDKKFYKHLQEMSAVDISVAEEKQLGCSIGIAEFYSFQEKAINEAINQADQALYEMKHHSKGGYKVYQIKEEVSQE